MILSLRHIRRRIKSVENTKKMTRAMQMVAAAKLKKLQDLLRRSDRYIAELKRILGTLVLEKPLAHPLLEKRTAVKSILAILITSDTGLCGSYNSNVLELARKFLPQVDKTAAVRFAAVGRNGANFLNRLGCPVIKQFAVPRPSEIEGLVRELKELAALEFQNQTADEVVFIYTHAASLGSLRPAVGRLFPIESDGPRARPGMNEAAVDYLLEPSLNDILDIMLPEFIEVETARFLKHSFAAEQTARMLAMRQATDNASEMIESLTLERNKARQASITKELIEVVSGSRALQVK